MPNPTFQAIISAVNESATAFKSVRTDLAAVRKESDLAAASLVKLDKPNALANLRASTQALTGHFGALNSKIGETHGFLKGLFPAIAAFGTIGSIAGLFNLVGKVAEARVEFNTMADRIGISTKALGQFLFAAKMTHVPAEALEGGLIKLNKAMGDAAIGKNKMAAAVLQRLGFNLKDIRSGAVTAADVLPRLANSFGKTENAAIKTAVAQALLGKGGAALIPMLNQGSDAWQKYAKEAAEFKYAFTPEDNKNLEEYERSTIRLDAAVKGLTNGIAAGLAPVLGPLNNQMAHWIAANREWITTGITGAVRDFSDLLKQQDWKGIGGDIQFMATGAKDLFIAVGGLKPILEVLIGLKVGSWLLSAGGLLFKVAAGLDAVTNAIPGFVAAWALVPGWVLALMKTGSIGLGAYLGFTAGAKPIATDEQERKVIAAEGGRVRDAEGGRGGAPISPYVPPPMPDAAALSRVPIIMNLRTDEPIIVAPPSFSMRRFGVEPYQRPASSPPEPAPPPTVPSAPLVWPGGGAFPAPPSGGPAGPLTMFPSPFAPGGPRQSSPAPATTGVDGQLKITVDIPNLPPDSRVTTERTGNVPEPAVNVGHSDPMSPY